MAFQLNDNDVMSYHRDGFLLVPQLFDSELIAMLSHTARADQRYQSLAVDRSDREGASSRLSLRYDLPEDLYGGLVRSEDIVLTTERLLGEEVYHYHHKMMMKEPFVGGAWEWHQDYGYWYHGWFLSPAITSCMIAVDRATRANGCLQVIPGSHALGRIDHGGVGDQMSANQERVDAILSRYEKTYVEMDPGDALFFHSNLLHRSDQNTSPDPRWVLICCYAARSNEPANGLPPAYEYLERWSVDRIKEIGKQHLMSLTGSSSASP